MQKFIIFLLPLIRKVRNKLLSIIFRDQIIISPIENLYIDAQKISILAAKKVSTPETSKMDFHWEAKHLQTADHQVSEVYLYQLKNVIFCPQKNILLSNPPQFIIEESISRSGFSGNKAPSKTEYYNQELKFLSGTCSAIRSIYYKPYYHMLIDNIPRLYQLCNDKYTQNQNIKLIFSNPLSEVEEFLVKKLIPSNFEVLTVSQDFSYLVEEFIYSSFLSQKFSGYLPLEFHEWFQAKVLPNRPSNKNKRIFIMRKGRRSITNNSILLKYLEQEGFQGYYLEDMSIEQQIELFYDAEFVVAAHGAGLANIIFSQKIKLLELFPTPQVLPHFYYLSKSMGHDYQYWCGNSMYRDSNFKVNTSEIIKLVENFSKSALVKF